MRQIFLDTETTGLETSQGHRIIELAAVEVVNRRFTGNRYHVYINPEREIDAGAQAVHGITLERLQGEPRFAEIVHEFLDFVAGAELVIHNAAFDMGFLNYELGLLDLPQLANAVIDTLKLARDMHPGQRNNLDALCKRYGIDNSNRTLHGALLDAELLADVYMAMTRGQESLMMDIGMQTVAVEEAIFVRSQPLLVVTATALELEAHEEYLVGLDKAAGGVSLWKQMES